MGRQTPLYDTHVAAGARMVDFGGWDMPVHYGSQLDEHHAVRTDAGLFDVSHMTVVDVAGEQAGEFLASLLANNPGKLKEPGAGLYSCMLNRDGGIIDDLIVYRMDAGNYRVVVNAATREADLAWMNEVVGDFAATLNERDDLAMLAVQGPAARERLAGLLEGADAQAALNLKPFHALACESSALFVARTGYTGEDGFEVLMPAAEAAGLWGQLVAAGVSPCGLGARDTLRLEAGLNLYGQDMDTGITPWACGLGWTVAMEPDDRDFIGRAALEAKQAETGERMAGLVLLDKGVMRSGQTVLTNAGEGLVTSGTFSPTLQKSVAMARLPVGAEGDCEVQIRNQTRRARIVSLPFVRKGAIKINLEELS